MRMRDKIVVVTGGGAGIGRELVINLLARGARVAAVDISDTGLQETTSIVGTLRDRLSTHVVNVADKAAVEALPAEVIEHHGAVDGVINNAGVIQPFVPVKDLEDAAIERVMDINFYGVLYMTRAFLPHLLQRPTAHIVNVSSMGGFLPVPGQSVYGASKAAVKLLTEALHSELAETNVRVTVVFPGAIGTDIAANSGIDMDRAQSDGAPSITPLPADKAAEIIIDAVEKDSYRVRVGRDALLMDYLYRLSPKFAANFIYKQMRSLLN